jgi:molybdopterin molybdotransferase
MQELCETKVNQKTNYVCIAADVCANLRKGSNIRRAGEDIATEDIILKKGHTLRPQDLGLAASVGVANIAVYRRLKVAIFSTGDELCEPGTALQCGQIYNSNRYTLTALLQSMACEVIDLGIVKDNLEATQAAMLQATEQADILMTSGGVSVGEEDHIRVALESLGQLNLWRINIKPGKPLAFGHIGDTPFLGLPGNPVSVFVTFTILARSYLCKLQGKTQIHPQYFDIAADFEFKRQASREEYFRVRLVENGRGEKVLQAYPHQGSGVLTSTTWAEGLARIPANTYINKGDKLRFYSFSG